VKLVVGLGNPGPRYARTRHNAGFRVAGCFAQRHAIELASERFGGLFGRGRIAARGGEPLDVGVLEPQRFMNRSGDAVALALSQLPIEDPARDVIVALDDVDLPFGRLRLRHGGGAAGQKGLAHIIERLGRDDLPRLRFGVGRPTLPMDTAAWVLERFSDADEQALPELVARAADALDSWLFEGLEAAMNRFNVTAARADEKKLPGAGGEA
jgi:PTH1 family peptidyl-tRNA hydrolase